MSYLPTARGGACRRRSDWERGFWSGDAGVREFAKRRHQALIPGTDGAIIRFDCFLKLATAFGVILADRMQALKPASDPAELLAMMHTPYAFRPGDEQDPRDQKGNVIYDEGITLMDTWRAMEELVDRAYAGRSACRT